MRVWLLLPLALLAACGDDTPTDDTGGEDDTDTPTDSDTVDDTSEPEDTTPPAPANAKADGTWALSSGGSTCNASFAGDWEGTPSTANDQAFTITLTAEQRTLNCSFDLADPTRFTCNDVSQGGFISQCDVTISITQVNGTVIDASAQLNAQIQMSSGACGQALNCGPSPHTSSGTITP